MDNTIKSIDPASPLHGRAHIGDAIVEINGHEIIDVLDYKFFAYDERLHVTLRRPDGTRYTVTAVKSEGGDLGLDFESYLMDAPRACANRCIFCFVDQLPRGMRRTMYFKDDDARLSFLLGNYITLTNLSEREIERICALHISPVNVSVHTTNPELRRRMLRNDRAGECMELMRRFAQAGIVMNCQIVCCPEINDGAELRRSLTELAALYPQVNSVAIVPVGLTKFREKLYPLTPFTPEYAAETIDMVEAFGAQCIEKYGSRIAYCSDEFYLKAGRDMPEDEFYEGYCQLENGVGMLRLLETEFRSALKLSDAPDGVPFSIATGAAAAPLMKKLLDMAKKQYPALDGTVYTIVNDFFGHSIDVAGLVTGGDLIRQLRGKRLGERLLISRNMLRRDEMDFLDDVTIEQAVEALGVPIYPIGEDGFELWDAMSGVMPEVKTPVREESREEFYKYN